MPEPRFAIFVRSVPGRTVSRFGSRSSTLIGARFASESEIAAGSERVIWSDRIVPIAEEAFRKFRREYTSALRLGDLTSATEAEWLAQCAADATSEPKPKKAQTT